MGGSMGLSITPKVTKMPTSSLSSFCIPSFHDSNSTLLSQTWSSERSACTSLV
ncbi:hypothetical protein PF005_g29209 [Phytophthora fragariae]|uniref:Uncharacterized protein n=2 Tax=Phytophthora TaxID=4783 RepID=A0A6A3QA94_9STRA|nr:hypothetical protein PF003_g32271 [Phytophthora fragariae]KAE8966820.1 hypothetical protein PR002_g28252 [Phytophthora rubi]KAE8920043.1 hypothetical protein PF009_g29657 [Phytophthora fragariae]KAE8967339.1 hypothetical protein PR001_g28133 [Phytophthora rubi]KAE9063849.1 hypothetical protein PF010_g28834 [Phytophthora fragariae]